MKNKFFFLLVLFCSLFLLQLPASAQCSVCTRTADQLGEKPAASLNYGILYLAAIPLGIYGVIGYRWWRSNRDQPLN